MVQIRQKEENNMTDEQNKKILLAHGGGGRLTAKLIDDMILPRFNNAILAQLTDSALLQLDSTSLCFTTDSFVVKPLFFNGGDIGKLAVCGTVNDLAVAGAKPLALSLSLIIEEGLEIKTLEKILDSAAKTAAEANIPIVAGDTKVVETGAADKIFINTAGVGTKIPNVNISFDKIAPGDSIIINGTIGDHGMTIVSQREDLNFDSPIQSDCACLHELIERILHKAPDVKFMRDPTRGGLAATLNEIAARANCDIEITEEAIPANPTVRAAADVLGFDLLDIANEGKVVIVVSPGSANDVIDACRQHTLGKNASIIGRTKSPQDVPVVELITKIKGRRIVQTPYGRELPRIC
jgi:hydrogenase expression/formation protein HypE